MEKECPTCPTCHGHPEHDKPCLYCGCEYHK